MAKDTIRFGLGDPNGWRSSSWRMWRSGAGRDVYLANRDVGNWLKVSLHDSGDWRYAWERAALARLAEPPDQRLIKDWEPEEGRVERTPLRQAFAVVLGRFSLGWHPALPDEEQEFRRLRQIKGVNWIRALPPSGAGKAWQFTALIADPGVQTTPPGTRAMGSVPVGGFVLPDGSSVWLMRHQVTLSDEGQRNVRRIAQATGESLAPSETTHDFTVYRCHTLVGPKDGLRSIIEVAVNHNVPRHVSPPP